MIIARTEKILFVGGGNMTCAIIDGLLFNKYAPENIFVVDHNEVRRNYLLQNYKINVLAEVETCISLVQVVVLAVKPQVAKVACIELGQWLSTKQLIISVMAGITTATLGEWLGESCAIVRTMPNLPAAIGEGATGLYANKAISPQQQQLAESILATVGITAWLTQEEDLNTITALSGSGPAYYFYFMEIMQTAAIKMGLDAEIAKQFAIQTAYGAAKFARDSQQDLTTLKDQVTSKKGATQAGLNVMQSHNINGILEEALQAVSRRALELSQPEQL